MTIRLRLKRALPWCGVGTGIIRSTQLYSSIKHKIGDIDKNGSIRKFLDIMKLSDDDEYDDDDIFDDEYDAEMRRKPKKSFLQKKEKHYEADEAADICCSSTVHTAYLFNTINKVTPMRQPARRSKCQYEVCVIKPTSVDDAREITETY